MDPVQRRRAHRAPQRGLIADDRGEQAQLTELPTGQQPGQRGQHRTVGPRQPQGLNLTLEHGHLVTQDQDLRVLGAIGAGEQGEPAEHAAPPGRPIVRDAPVSTYDRITGTRTTSTAGEQ